MTAVHDTLVTNDTDCADEVKLRSEVGLAAMVMLQKVAENWRRNCWPLNNFTSWLDRKVDCEVTRTVLVVSTASRREGTTSKCHNMTSRPNRTNVSIAIQLRPCLLHFKVVESCSDISHTRTVVRECCKGDYASQWRNRKFDPTPRPNPLTDCHQKLQTWLCPGKCKHAEFIYDHSRLFSSR